MKTLKKFYIITDTLNNTYLTNNLIFTDNIDDVNIMRFADISMAIARLTSYNKNIRYAIKIFHNIRKILNTAE